MGIGTLIIFIAMILVSAIAAGMLINAANLLQEQGEETGKMAIDTVVTSLMIQDMVGDRSNANGSLQSNIQVLVLKISLPPGSPRLAMEHVIIGLTAGSVDTTLEFDHSDTAISYMHQWNDHDPADMEDLKRQAGAGKYTAAELRDPDDTFFSGPTDTDEPDFVVSQGCLIEIFIDLAGNGIALGPQGTLFMKLIPKHGIPAIDYVVAPEAFKDRYVQL